MLAGDPGVGKSYLTAALATHVSRGTAWPDGAPCPQGTVAMLSREDHQDRIVERLMLLNANRSRIRLVKAMKIDPEDGDPEIVRVSLTEGLHARALREYIERLGAILCIVDPIDLYMAHDTQSKTGPAARSFTTPLAELAAATGCCVVMVQHLNTAPGQQPIYRVKDSIDFLGAQRAVLRLRSHGRDPQAPAAPSFKDQHL
jgi:RecA-family ATPase